MPFSPADWDGLSKLGILVTLVGFHITAYMRNWLIPGRHHRELIDRQDAEIKDLKVRAAVDAETIQIQANTIAEKNAVEAASTALMKAFREAAEQSAGRGVG